MHKERHRRRRAALLAIAMLLVAVATMSKAAAEVYRNRYSSAPHGEMSGELLKFLWRMRTDPADVPQLPRRQPDVAALKLNRGQPTLTWVGHATFLVQIGGLNVITDPHLTSRASPLSFAGPKRFNPPALDFHELPPLDLALISHNHYDHLDAATVERLAREHPQLQFVVPLGLADWMRGRGIERVIELDWWQATDMSGARVSAVPVQHFSGRGAFDRNKSKWAGFVLETTGRKIFFAGDTGYSQDFRDIAARFGAMDLSLIPIGAYDPRSFMAPVHVDPEEAVRIHQDLGSWQSVAMHWGTFRLTLEPLDEPPVRLRKALVAAGIAEDRFWVMEHGETRVLWPALATVEAPPLRSATSL